MFYYIHLNKNLIDIRLSNPIDSNNFHSHMENLGRINQVLILCWELNIRFIKIANIIGEIKFGFPYPLLADTDKVLINSFGVWGFKKFMGKEYEGILRTTFVLNKEGVITKVIEKVKTKDHTSQILDL